MKTNEKNKAPKEGASPAGDRSIIAPTVEQVREFIKKDLEAAHYFLGLMLRYPDVLDRAAADIHGHAMSTEQGAAIDHVKDAKS